ncbi:dTDP-4-amino-4,6-dideoxygalactose transaminase [Ulvibacterium sp.]|uniref:dTDP-4-amino-4,6-dideoxygalactose transaminase n=1 Tax=Ulvibacterium sp. TaxID=2665914 RepID=UPI003CC62CDF
MKIPFNRPYLTGNEEHYVNQAISSGKISGNGMFTQKCQNFFEKNYAFKKTLLTTSCTDALEMCAILLDIAPGDEVIMPAYTFVSTANAFVMRGAQIVFCDSMYNHPNVDAEAIEVLLTPKTKAIVVVHYAGVACDMDKIMGIAQKHGLFVVEDAAQAVNAFYKGRPLGGIGHLGTFSFHETKNISSGEGGMLVVNDERFLERAEIIWEKGTNRTAFFRGEIDKYGWIDIGSSFLPSDITAAFLFAQLECMEELQGKRRILWNTYHQEFEGKENAFKLLEIPAYADHNFHIYYVCCDSQKHRDYTLGRLRKNGTHAVFHYQGLHDSPFYKDKYRGRELVNSDFYSNTLLRLPLFYELSVPEVQNICSFVLNEG